MVMMYPSRENIDAWGRLGSPGWSWDTLEPYYRKMATVTPPGENARTVADVDWYDPSLGGGSGPLQVTWGEGYAENLQGAWVRSFNSLGLEMNGDPRSGSAIGGFQNMQAIHPRTKTRSYAPNAWYNAAARARENLVVMTGTLAKKIVTRRGEKGVVATGVVIQKTGGEEQLVHARKEVILAAGVFQSPQLLELSGIGGRSLLEKHDIPVVIDNAAVGENLQDHAIVAQLFEIKEGVYSLDRLRDPDFRNQALLLFATNGTGPLAQAQLASAYTPFMDLEGRMGADEVKAMLDEHLGEKGTNKEYDVLREDMERANRNQVQYHLFPATLTAPDASGAVPAFTTPHVAAMALLSHPFSRGSVHIVSGAVEDKPSWDPAFMSHPLDIEILARSVQFTEKIVSAAPFADSLTGKRFPDKVADTVEKAKEIVREVTISSFHPSGSLAMKPREDGGVVDERLRVYGTENVRVVDASVFPLEPSGNIMATVYAVAERAADIIKEDGKK
jgi:choline dehydrogenase-like flavoprotein